MTVHRDLGNAILGIIEDVKTALTREGSELNRIDVRDTAVANQDGLQAILPAQILAWKNRQPPVIPPGSDVNGYLLQRGFITVTPEGAAAWTEIADQVFFALGLEQIPLPEPEK